MVVTTTPQQVGTGEYSLLISVIDDASKSNEFIQFGFGSVAPTEWHTFYQAANEKLRVGIGFGPLWLKCPQGRIVVTVTTGV